MDRQPFLKSIQNAAYGVKELFLTERNFRIDIFFALLALFFSILTRTRGVELVLIILCIALVLSLEAFNSALEAAVDLTIQELHPLAKKSKDMAAGSVLLSALLSVVVGGIVFLPKLLAIFHGKLRITESVLAPLALSGAAIIVYFAWIAVHPLPEVNTSEEEMV